MLRCYEAGNREIVECDFGLIEDVREGGEGREHGRVSGDELQGWRGELRVSGSVKGGVAREESKRY